MRVPRYTQFSVATVVVALVFAGFGTSAAYADDAVPTSSTSASTATTSPEAPVAEAPAQAAPVTVPAQPATPEVQPAAATPSTAPEVPAPAVSEAAAPAVPDEAAPAPSEEPVTVKETTVPKTAPATQPVTEGSHSSTKPGHPSPQPEEKACTPDNGNEAVSIIDRNADLSTVTVKLNAKKFSSCDVLLQTFETEGATWETSGTQVFNGSQGVTLTKQNPIATLTVVPKGCFTQQDASVGSLAKNDGIEAPLPHYPDSDAPYGAIATWIGGADCTPAPPKEPVAGDASATDTMCLADRPVGNSLTIAGEGKTTSTVSANGTAPKAASNGTFTDELLGINGYPASYVVTLTGEDGSTKVFEHTFQQPKTAADCAPVTVVPPKATIDQRCYVVHAHLSNGSNDADFVLLINDKSVKTYHLKAWESLEVSYKLGEGLNDGNAVVAVEVNGSSVSDAISKETGCAANTPKPTPTPSDTPKPNPTPPHHDTPQPTPSTAPVAVQHNTPTGGNTGTLAFTGANVGAPIIVTFLLLATGAAMLMIRRRRVMASDSSES